MRRRAFLEEVDSDQAENGPLRPLVKFTSPALPLFQKGIRKLKKKRCPLAGPDGDSRVPARLSGLVHVAELEEGAGELLHFTDGVVRIQPWFAQVTIFCHFFRARRCQLAASHDQMDVVIYRPPDTATWECPCTSIKKLRKAGARLYGDRCLHVNTTA